ncbi:MAG: aldo/keto reductase [Spirochaetaceae bacterium]|jgi:predicted aldo/keto reductase-like oxidoreductase|nr:aldo/keto reductase [Spirochaetaceae bacterium]
MKYRVDKVSGNKLSVLGFGCMRFPHIGPAIDINLTEKLIMKAVDAGVNYFDTAYLYPGSEDALGQILERNGARDKVFIASKLPMVMLRKKEDIEKCFQTELKHLRTDHIDYYLMHMLTDLAQWEKFCSWGIEEWIAAKKASGQIRQIGFSFHGSCAEYLKILEKYPADHPLWEFAQIQYNYSDENYQAGVTGLKKTAEMGLPVIIMEPLLGGKLANLSKEAATIFADLNKSLDKNYSPAVWAFRWLWNQSEPTVVLSGMNSMAQLDDNLAAADEAEAGILTEAEIEAYQKVRTIFRASYKIPCTGCNYCMPCPQGVNIPGLFAAYNTRYSQGFMSGMQQYMTSTHVTSDHTGRPGNCIACCACEKHCPQHLPIIHNLKEVRRKMEFQPVGIGIDIARAFLGRKGK